MKLLTVGTVAFDTVESPYGKVERTVAGSCMYSAWSASFFIQSVGMISIIGDDFPEEELHILEKRGVSTAGIQRIQGAKSFYWHGRYHPDMIHRDSVVTELNVLENFHPQLPDDYTTTPYILLGNLTPTVQQQVIDQLAEHTTRLVVLDTMDYWIKHSLEELQRAIALADVLSINDEEARLLSGERSLVVAAAKILQWGPSYLIIKKGEHGAFLFSSDDIFFVPALPLAVVKDPTGAGDTFAGGFLGYLAATDDTSFNNMKRAMVYGSAMASFVVEEFGLQRLKTLTRDEIQQRVLKFKDLVSFNL